MARRSLMASRVNSMPMPGVWSLLRAARDPDHPAGGLDDRPAGDRDLQVQHLADLEQQGRAQEGASLGDVERVEANAARDPAAGRPHGDRNLGGPSVELSLVALARCPFHGTSSTTDEERTSSVSRTGGRCRTRGPSWARWLSRATASIRHRDLELRQPGQPGHRHDNALARGPRGALGGDRAGERPGGPERPQLDEQRLPRVADGSSHRHREVAGGAYLARAGGQLRPRPRCRSAARRGMAGTA